MLTAYYDLAVSPATYDIVAFLSAAEVERRKQPDQPMHVVFLPGPNGGFRRDRFWPFSIPMREMMRDRVAVPMAKMMPSTSVSVLQLRPQKPDPNSIGFGHSLYGLAVHVKALQAGWCRPLRAPLTPRRKERLVTITLRECEHWPQRNSNANAWLEAAIVIRDLGYDVVALRDEICADALFGDFAIAPSASRDLEIRARLYGSAACNMFVNNGPAWFAIALDAPVLMLKPTVENLNRSCSASYFRDCGIDPGKQIPGSPQYQRIVWEDDTAPNIIAAFNDFMQTVRPLDGALSS